MSDPDVLPSVVRPGPTIKHKRRHTVPRPSTMKEITGGRWTKGEDDQLRRAVKQYGEGDWERLSLEVFDGRRTAVQCIHRWTKVRTVNTVESDPGLGRADHRLLTLGRERRCFARGRRLGRGLRRRTASSSSASTLV